MPFNESFDRSRIFQVLQETMSECGLHAFRVDELPTSADIITEIRNEIRKAKFCVFDLSDERPNVYYELGYADGLQRHPENIILIAQKDSKVHFDIAGRNLRMYNKPSDLKEILKRDLKLLPAWKNTRTESGPPEIGRSSTVIHKILDDCDQIDRTHNDFRKFIGRNLLEHIQIATRELATRERDFKTPLELTDAVAEALKQPNAVSVQAVCCGKPWKAVESDRRAIL
jgi:hypothetical protein